MNCDCLKTITEKLKLENLKISDNLKGFTYPEFKLSLFLTTSYIDKDKVIKGKKNSPPKIHVSFCPFCGVAVKDKKEEVEKV